MTNHEKGNDDKTSDDEFDFVSNASIITYGVFLVLWLIISPVYTFLYFTRAPIISEVLVYIPQPRRENITIRLVHVDIEIVDKVPLYHIKGPYSATIDRDTTIEIMLQKMNKSSESIDGIFQVGDNSVGLTMVEKRWFGYAGVIGVVDIFGQAEMFELVQLGSSEMETNKKARERKYVWSWVEGMNSTSEGHEVGFQFLGMSARE